MASRAVRFGVCALIGLFAGLSLGFLVTPDSTSPIAPVLGILIAVVVGAGLYRTGFMGDDVEVPG